MRPRYWVKNLLVFVPVLAAHDLSPDSLLRGISAFLIFTIATSGNYMLNDLWNLDQDRLHPMKKKRPIASGKISVRTAYLVSILLIVTSVALSTTLTWTFSCFLILYLALAFVYSRYVKHLPILELFLLVSLYLIRIWGGAVATDTALSGWLFAFTAFIFLALVCLKRLAEVCNEANEVYSSTSGRPYNTRDVVLLTAAAVSAGFSSTLILSLYVFATPAILFYRAPEFLWGICLIVLFWILYMTYRAAQRAIKEDPVHFLMVDRTSQICAVLTLALLVMATNWS